MITTQSRPARRYSLANGLEASGFVALTSDPQDNLYLLARTGLSLWVRAIDQWRSIPVEDEALAACAGDIGFEAAVDVAVNPNNGRLYLAFDDGIAVRIGDVWSCWRAGNGILPARITTVHVDGNDARWVGTLIGASIFRDGSGWNAISQIDGLPGSEITRFASKGLQTWIMTPQGIGLFESSGDAVDIDGELVSAMHVASTPAGLTLTIDGKLDANR